MMRVWDFAKTHWHRLLEVGIVGVAFTAGAALRGAELPPRVEIKTVYVDRIVEKKIEVERRVLVEGETRIVYRDRVITPDGTQTIKETERVEVASTEQHDIVRQSDRDQTRSETREQVVPPAASRTKWRASLLAGVDLAPSWQPIPNGGPLTIGAHVEWRLVGPVWVGAWALHTGAGGLSIGAEF